MAGRGGIFNSRNLGMYGYAGLNPMIFVDPDGNELVKIELTPEAAKFISFKDNAYSARGLVVDSKFAPKVKQFLTSMVDAKIHVKFNSTFRTTAEQENERKATNSLATKDISAHEAGLGVDISVSKNPSKDGWVNPADISEVGKAAKKADMRRGSTFNDPPHLDAGSQDQSVFGYKNRGEAAEKNQADWKSHGNGATLPTTPLKE